MVAVNIITCITKLFVQLDACKYSKNQTTCIIGRAFFSNKKKSYENLQLIAIIFQSICHFLVLCDVTIHICWFFFQSFVSVIIDRL